MSWIDVFVFVVPPCSLAVLLIEDEWWGASISGLGIAVLVAGVYFCERYSV